MKSLSLQPYSPIISDKTVGERIYNEILGLDPKENRVEIDMAGIRSKFSFARGEYLGEIASLLEDVVEIASLCRIPAVLCAEAADLAVNQTAV